MNKCLKDQDLTLLHYGELPSDSNQARHVSNCQKCQKKLTELSSELESLPKIDYIEHPAIATRMAARVTEQLQRPRRRWLPITGTLAVSTCALVATFMVWSPQQETQQITKLTATTQTEASISLEGEMPDIDFLEDMELLMELELLSQVEGV